jgi:choline-sulfatase
MRRRPPTRRDVLKAAAASAALAARGRAAPARATPTRPNFLVVLCDQLGLDALGVHGCPDVHTPHLDRLAHRGTTFLESHSTNPVCSPARSSLMTGRMPVETGVTTNNRPIHASCPNLGQWLRQAGYETVYCGKWHLPGGVPRPRDGFLVLPARKGQGDLDDAAISRTCEAYLGSRSHDRPYLMVASFLQPHDICFWGNHAGLRVPDGLPFPALRDSLPELPPNLTSRPAAPAKLAQVRLRDYSELQWRYYLYIYARMVEMLDADVGRVLDAVDARGQADNTIVLFTSDHGDGRGRHGHVAKWYPYDEAVKVPFIAACPGRIAENHTDSHLVSGLDLMSTVCDYAGLPQPAHVQGRSLRPLLERREIAWRDFVVCEHRVTGRSIRTKRFKYVRYEGDPIEQLFDMQGDPWETRNLYQDAQYAGVLEEHRKRLDAFLRQLRPVAPTPLAGRPARPKGKAGRAKP